MTKSAAKCLVTASPYELGSEENMQILRNSINHLPQLNNKAQNTCYLSGIFLLSEGPVTAVLCTINHSFFKSTEVKIQIQSQNEEKEKTNL